MSAPTILQRILGAKAGTRSPSSTEIEAELKVERKAQAESTDVLAALHERRRTFLLTGNGEVELDKLEGEIAVATRSRDRAAARTEALESALAQAIENERRVSIQATYDAAKKKINAALDWQTNRYDSVAAELAAGFKMLVEADDLATGNTVEIPDGAEPLIPPSHDRSRSNFSNQPRLYADTRKLQSADPDAEPHWLLSRPMLPY